MIDCIQFRPIELGDRELIQSYTLVSGERICDYAFANLYGWRKLYKTAFAVHRDTLLIRFELNHLGKDHPYYLPPIGQSLEGVRECLLLLQEEADRENYPLIFMSVSDGALEWLEEVSHANFIIREHRDGCDYLYLRERLVSLSGKKLQSKRNHINKFERLYPEYEVVAIDQGLVKECIRLEQEWLKGQEKTESRLAEEAMIEDLLSNIEPLGLLGVALKVGGHVVAFSLGSVIGRDTFGVHIEKANTDYEGSFAMINQAFAKRIPETFTYVNREEDMGLPGLRQAKLSYQPEELLCKKIVTYNGY